MTYRNIHRWATWFRALLCLYALTIAFTALAGDKAPSRTAIIGALDEEVRLTQQRMQDKQTETFLGVTFTTGVLNGRPIVLAQTGVGKVNAAMTTTLLLDHFKPSEVIFTGVAGGLSPDLFPGDVVIATKLAQHDLGICTADGFHTQGVKNPITGQRNPVFFLSDATLVGLSQQARASATRLEIATSKGLRRPNVVSGVVVTGDVFVASADKKDQLRRCFSADAVEMEGAAVAQVCYEQNVPFVVLRCVSDTADANAPDDFKKFCTTAATNSSELVFQLVGLLAKSKP